METQIRILLPVCSEVERDVFFKVVQNLISRTKLDEHFLDNAFKIGMTGEEFCIEIEDTTDNWLQRDTEEQQVRQSKILGYWASEHFPVIAKKFYGLKWKPPQRKGIEVVGHEETLSAKEIDEIVFKKLKLRLIELSVTPSTLQKLRLFMFDIPADIGKKNENSLAPAIKSFEIDDDSVDDCWNIVKFGTHI